MGDGKTNPFGDTAGGGGPKMGKGVNFVENPGGTTGAKGGGQPGSYGQNRTQQRGSDEVNPNEIPDGGKDLKADPGPDPGNPIGTTAEGGSKPFKVS